MQSGHGEQGDSAWAAEDGGPARRAFDPREAQGHLYAHLEERVAGEAQQERPDGTGQLHHDSGHFLFITRFCFSATVCQTVTKVIIVRDYIRSFHLLTLVNYINLPAYCTSAVFFNLNVNSTFTYSF